MNWHCQHCKNEVDDGFEVCWSCGASISGEENPHFSQEIDATKLPPDGERYIECAKCGYRGKSIQVKAVDGLLAGFYHLFFGFRGLSNLTNHACPKCNEARQIFDWQP